MSTIKVARVAERGYTPLVLDTVKIKAVREARGLTHEQAAAAAGFKSRQNWYAVESGKRGGENGITLGTLDAIAKALDCDPRDLLTTPANGKPGRA